MPGTVGNQYWLPMRDRSLQKIGIIGLIVVIVLHSFEGVIRPFEPALDLVLLGLFAFAVFTLSQEESLEISSSQLVSTFSILLFIILFLSMGLLSSQSLWRSHFILPLFGGLYLFLSTQVFVRSRYDLRLLLLVIGVMAVVLSSLSILQMLGITSSPALIEQPKSFFLFTITRSGPFGIPSADGYGIFVTVGALVWLGGFLEYDQFAYRVPSLAALALCFAGIFVTFNRGTFLVVAVALLVVFFYRLDWRGRVLLCSLLLTVGIIGSYLTYQSWLFYSGTDLTASTYIPRSIVGNLSNRVTGIFNGIAIWQESPLTGAGIGSYTQVNTKSHNTYAWILASSGIFAFLAFLLVLVYLPFTVHRRVLSRTDSVVPELLIGSQAGLITAMLFFVGIYASATDVWIVISLVATLPRVFSGRIQDPSYTASPERVDS
jgi:hypothetical protein